jgi:membrane-bound ClpP family serine protease
MKGQWFADPFRWLAVALLITGIVMAALEKTFAGFTPVVWILLGMAALLTVICGEVLSIRQGLEARDAKK